METGAQLEVELLQFSVETLREEADCYERKEE